LFFSLDSAIRGCHFFVTKLLPKNPHNNPHQKRDDDKREDENLEQRQSRRSANRHCWSSNELATCAAIRVAGRYAGFTVMFASKSETFRHPFFK
jgi:ABC-type Zn2+ transport system substrate-binding protein/surface adhesin